MTFHPRRARKRLASERPTLLQTARHYRRRWEGGAKEFAFTLRSWGRRGEGGLLESYQRYWRWESEPYAVVT